MRKFIVFLTKLTLAATVALFMASCETKGITGSGNVTTENRPVTADFKSVEAGNGLDVVIEQSDKLNIAVEADDNLQKHITTHIENGILIIKSDINSYTNATKRITVQMPVIESLEAHSGVNMNSKNTLKTVSLSVNSSSGATVALYIEAEKANCEASSGSHISVEGKVIELGTATSSGSGIDAQKLLSNNVIAKASSGSNIDVYPLVSLNADASSGSSVTYHHVPANITQQKSSGGNVNKA